MNVNSNLTTQNLKVKCGLCEKSFFGEFLSKRMRVSHPGVERMECLDCKKIFSIKGAARKHYRKWHMAKNDGNNFTCKVCTQEFQ